MKQRAQKNPIQKFQIDRVYKTTGVKVRRETNGTPHVIFYRIEAQLSEGFYQVTSYNAWNPQKPMCRRVCRDTSLSGYHLALVPLDEEPKELQSQDGKRLAAARKEAEKAAKKTAEAQQEKTTKNDPPGRRSHPLGICFSPDEWAGVVAFAHDQQAKAAAANVHVSINFSQAVRSLVVLGLKASEGQGSTCADVERQALPKSSSARSPGVNGFYSS